MLLLMLSVYALDPAVWAAVLITGSGTPAVESMMAAAARPSRRPCKRIMLWWKL
jgi:hypothetical protein